MAILDSCAVIELIDGTDKGRAIKEKYGSIITASTTISMHEVLFGCTPSKRQRVAPLFHALELLPFDVKSAEKSIELDDYLSKAGRKINKPDVFIASICLAYGLPIVTTDKHFLNVPGLKVFLI